MRCLKDKAGAAQEKVEHVSLSSMSQASLRIRREIENLLRPMTSLSAVRYHQPFSLVVGRKGLYEPRSQLDLGSDLRSVAQQELAAGLAGAIE